VNFNVIENEFKFIPDIGNNLELPESEQMVICWKRINTRLDSYKYVDYQVSDDNAKVNEINFRKFYKSHLTKIINPPIFEKENGERIEATIDDLFDGQYSGPQIDSLVDMIIEEIEEKSAQQKNDIKKS
jgi:hypothetical protein